MAVDKTEIKKLTGILRREDKKQHKTTKQAIKAAVLLSPDDPVITTLATTIKTKRPRGKPYKEKTLSNAERQRRYKQRQKEKGLIRRTRYETPSPDPGYEFIQVNVHKSSFDSISILQKSLTDFLTPIRKIAPDDVYLDILEFLEVMGFSYDRMMERISAAEKLLLNSKK